MPSTPISRCSRHSQVWRGRAIETSASHAVGCVLTARALLLLSLPIPRCRLEPSALVLGTATAQHQTFWDALPDNRVKVLHVEEPFHIPASIPRPLHARLPRHHRHHYVSTSLRFSPLHPLLGSLLIHSRNDLLPVLPLPIAPRSIQPVTRVAPRHERSPESLPCRLRVLLSRAPCQEPA